MTSGSDIAGICSCRFDITPQICLTCQIDNAIAEVQTAFQKHLANCSSGFYGRLAAKKCNEVDQLKRQIEELKKQVYPQWV